MTEFLAFVENDEIEEGNDYFHERRGVVIVIVVILFFIFFADFFVFYQIFLIIIFFFIFFLFIFCWGFHLAGENFVVIFLQNEQGLESFLQLNVEESFEKVLVEICFILKGSQVQIECISARNAQHEVVFVVFHFHFTCLLFFEFADFGKGENVHVEQLVQQFESVFVVDGLFDSLLQERQEPHEDEFLYYQMLFFFTIPVVATITFPIGFQFGIFAHQLVEEGLESGLNRHFQRQFFFVDLRQVVEQDEFDFLPVVGLRQHFRVEIEAQWQHLIVIESAVKLTVLGVHSLQHLRDLFGNDALGTQKFDDVDESGS